MRWLFVTTECPWPIIHGRWLRVYHLARSLAAMGETVGVMSYPGTDEASEAYSRAGVQCVAGPVGERVTSGPGRCFMAPYAFDEKMAEAVRENAREWDVVVLAGQTVLQYAPEARAARTVLAEMVDDPCLETGRRLWKNLRPGVFLRRLQKLWGQPRYERVFVDEVDVFTFVSEHDCESFQRRSPAARVECIPNGVDVDYFARPADRPMPGGEPRVVFTGHMSHLPNEDAAECLVREIGPHLWQECPDARIQLVGADPGDKVRSLASDRVEVTGRVPDIRPYLWDATVVAVPMRIGTGIKNKLLEAWAAGAPVVTTSMACQGVSAKAGENILVGDGAQSFCREVLSVVRQERLEDELRCASRRAACAMSWQMMTEGLVSLVTGRKKASPSWEAC